MRTGYRLALVSVALIVLLAFGVRMGKPTDAVERCDSVGAANASDDPGAGGGATSPENRTADRAAITGVLNAQQAAWNRGDVDAFLTGYWHSPELTFSGSSGVSRGWDGVLARYKKNYPDRAAMGQLDFSELEYRFLGPYSALVLGHWHLKRDKGDIGGVFSLVWMRLPDGWKIIHDHTSAVER